MSSFLHEYIASNAVRPEACSQVYEYRGCHTDNLASSGPCAEACLQLASTILWTQTGLDIVHDSCFFLVSPTVGPGTSQLSLHQSLHNPKSRS